MDPGAVVAVASKAPSYLQILNSVLSFGPVGLVLVFWYFGQQKTDEIQRRSGEQIQVVMDRYASDMQEMRNMYVTNAALVKRYEELAGDLKEVVTLNTQVMTRLVDRIDKGERT